MIDECPEGISSDTVLVQRDQIQSQRGGRSDGLQTYNPKGSVCMSIRRRDGGEIHQEFWLWYISVNNQTIKYIHKTTKRVNQMLLGAMGGEEKREGW